MDAIMSVDVEEWFHIPAGSENILTFDKWDSAAQRIQHVLPRMLDLFERNNVVSTFFFLGWIAEKHPGLVKEALNRGHEVATHGYAHKMIYNQTTAEFKNDIYKAKSIIENMTGHQVTGYRAPGFSITPDTEWAFEVLAEAGLKYDSSIFPAKRFFGHFEKFELKPAIVKTEKGEIIEFPQTIVDFGLFRLSCFGGGYFRLFPESLFHLMCGIIQKADRPLIMYIHPRDIDTGQPRINFPFLKQIRHYINISKTEHKLSNISSSLNFKSFEMLMADDAFIKKLKEYDVGMLKP
jgi:polysaccharide deacetylase family protein (PEP-CTERM system associated)